MIDGVFAITITLLVLDLRPPDVDAFDPAILQSLLPRLLIYLLAFRTIANQWVIHFQSFREVHYADLRLVWLNLINLLCVTLLPASTAMFGRFPREPLAAACFSINLLFMCASMTAVWVYIYRQRTLLARDTPPQLLKEITCVWLFISLGMIAALALGFVSTIAAAVMWVGWPWLVQFGWKRYRRRTQPDRMEQPRGR